MYFFIKNNRIYFLSGEDCMQCLRYLRKKEWRVSLYDRQIICNYSNSTERNFVFSG